MAIIRIQNTSNINAEGTRTNRNRKPVFCITTGIMYASASDAAEKIGCTQGNMSWALTGRMRTCKGMRFCYVAEIIDHLEEIADIARKRAEKETAYNAIVAKEEAFKKANENVAKHQAKCEELRRMLAAEEQKLKTAEITVKNLIRG